MINGCANQTSVMMPHETYDTLPSSCLTLTTYEKSEIEKTIRSFNILKDGEFLYQELINSEYRQQRLPFIVLTNVITNSFANYGDVLKIVIAILKNEIVISTPLSIQDMVNGVLWVGCIDSDSGKGLFEFIDKKANLAREDRAKWSAVKCEVEEKIGATLQSHHEQSVDVLTHFGTRLEGCGDFSEYTDDTGRTMRKEFFMIFVQKNWKELETYIEMLFFQKQFPIRLKKEAFVELEKKLSIESLSGIDSTLFYFILSLEANKIEGNEKAIECLDCCLKWLFIQERQFVLDIYCTLSEYLENQNEERQTVIRGIICRRIEILGFDKKQSESISAANKPQTLPHLKVDEHYTNSGRESRNQKQTSLNRRVLSTATNSRAYYSIEQYQRAVEQNWKVVEKLLDLEHLMGSWFKAKGVVVETEFHDLEASDRDYKLRILASLLKREPKRNKLFFEALQADRFTKTSSEKISEAIVSSLTALIT